MLRWQSCPHCNLFFTAPEDGKPVRTCPSCGKPQAEAPTPTATPCPAGPVKFNSLFASRHQVLSEAQVVPEAANCVQCGMCSYNCPMGIDVRAHAWRGKPIRDSHCLTCSECVNRCPRGVLRFERIPLFTGK